MSWRQVRQPNLDPVVTQGNVVLHDWLGYCLAYVQFAFGSGWAGISAWHGWSDITKVKHHDKNLPSDVYVPIWFDGYWNGQRFGHVAIYKDGKIWSSPISRKPYADVWTSIEQVERNYGMEYVGWSEDLGGTRVIEYVNSIKSMEVKKKMVTENELFVLYRFYLGIPITEYGYRERLGKQTFDQAAKEIKQSIDFRGKVAAATNGDLEYVNHMPEAIRLVHKAPTAAQATSNPATTLEPGLYEVK